MKPVFATILATCHERNGKPDFTSDTFLSETLQKSALVSIPFDIGSLKEQGNGRVNVGRIWRRKNKHPD